MKRSPKAWNKFHLINAVHNAATEPPANLHGDDRRRTGNEIVQWAYTLWAKPDSGVSKQDVDDMFLHLLKTGQVAFLCGRPFDPVNEPKVLSERHVGLKIMRERAYRIGGECQITSAPGQGAQVRFVLPRKQGEVA